MKILLINPHDDTYQHGSSAFKRRMSYYALTLPTLAALVPEGMAADIRIVDEGVEDLDGFGDADLVGITAVTPSAMRAYELADQARQQGIPVVLGGPHPTLMPDEAAQHADAVVLGYAEESWPRLLADFTAGNLRPLYAQNGGTGLKNLPLPRRDLLNLKKYLKIPSIQASRGCANRCKFCTIPVTWGQNFHHRPIDEVLKEIEHLGKKRLLFLDPSLAEDRTYAKQLLKELIPLKVKWGGLSTIRLALDDELVDLAAESGCRGILVGFESVSQKALNGINKSFNDVQRYKEAVKGFHDRGIAVLGTFVFGLDHEDEDVFKRTADFIDDARIDLVRYAVYTPFPGTPAFEELDREGRILTRDWNLYNTENVVFQPKAMSREQLQEGLKDAWRQTTSFRSIFKRVGWTRRLRFFSFALNLGFRFYAKRVVLKDNPLPPLQRGST